MAWRHLVLAALVVASVAPALAGQEGAQAGDPMRIVILVDNSQTPLEPLPQIRRGLQQFVNALPPNHELMLVTTGGRVILFCDDLSFDKDDSHYKSLKAVLDGGIEGRPDNVVLYATSNRRHLMPRDMIENERQSGVNPSEAVEEKVSLSDRFGLWLGFHACNQDDYLAMIRGYCDAFDIAIDDAELRAEAIEWSQTRGARSGRVAWQYVTDLAGRQGVRLG
jgi:predicted AAA+ superfamily ATPase